MSEPLREALEDMVCQFAYKGTRDGKLILHTGGLSALEEAFDALDWDDPHYVSDENACDVEGCNEWAVSLLYWHGLVLALCMEHTRMYRNEEPRPPIRQRVLDREARRGPDGVLRVTL